VAQRQIINGGFQLPNGSPLALGYLKMRLNVDATTGVDQIVAGRVVTVPLDSNGNISGAVLVWPNDQLIPINTVYVTQAFSASGQLCWHEELSIPSGAGSYSLSG
jgi:hypothetical protein